MRRGPITRAGSSPPPTRTSSLMETMFTSVILRFAETAADSTNRPRSPEGTKGPF
jgi:hypothetical protein